MARVEQQIKYHLRAIKMSQDQKNSPRTPKPKSLRGIEKQINQLTARISEGQINLRSSPTTPKMSKTLDQDIDLTLTKTPDEVSFYGTPMVLRSQCKQRVNPQMLEEMNRLKHLLKTEMEENQRKDEEIERLTATIQFLELKKTDEFKINALEEEKKELLRSYPHFNSAIVFLHCAWIASVPSCITFGQTFCFAGRAAPPRRTAIGKFCRLARLRGLQLQRPC